jgi:WD40 repeat protein
MIPLKTASGHPVTHILFSPDGSAVAVAQPHSGVTILERATGRTLTTCTMPRHATLTGLTFCGGGRFLAAASAKGIVVFDASTGARILVDPNYPKPRILADRGSVVLSAVLTKYAAVRPELWVSDSGVAQRSAKCAFYRSDFAIIGLSPNGSLVIGTERGEYALRGVGTPHLEARVERLTATEPSEKSVAKFCALGRRFAINDGRTLDVYGTADLAEGDEDDQPAATPLVQRTNGSQACAAPRDLSPAKPGFTAAPVAPMPHVVLAPTFTLKSEKSGVESGWYPPFALAADGRGLFVKRPRNRIQLWDAPTGTLVNEWSWRFEWVTCVAVSADGLTAVAGGRFGRVLLWDLE